MNRREFVATGSITLATITAGFSLAQKKQYVCPPCGCARDQDVFDASGTCPACGMTLIEKIGDAADLNKILSFRRLTDNIWTGGQPSLDHLAKLKSEGIKLIINLRPPAEHKGEEEEAKAREIGLRYINIPIVYNQPKDEDADAFLKVTDEELKNGPVFIHCAAAIRVGAFWMIRRVLRDGWTYDKALEEANQIGLRNRQHLIDFAKSYLEKQKKK